MLKAILLTLLAVFFNFSSVVYATGNAYGLNESAYGYGQNNSGGASNTGSTNANQTGLLNGNGHNNGSQDAQPLSADYTTQPTTSNPNDIGAPLDGGVSLLIAAGVGFGLKKANERKKMEQALADVL